MPVVQNGPLIGLNAKTVIPPQTELVEYCRRRGIVVEVYTPLAEGLFFDDPMLRDLAEKHSKTVPQIMLRWGLDYGVVVLSKSAHRDRIAQNIQIFDFQLDQDDMARLKTLNKNFRTNWDPTNIP